MFQKVQTERKRGNTIKVKYARPEDQYFNIQPFPRKSQAFATILARFPERQNFKSLSNIWLNDPILKSGLQQAVMPRLKRRERMDGFIKKTVLPFPRLG